MRKPVEDDPWKKRICLIADYLGRARTKVLFSESLLCTSLYASKFMIGLLLDIIFSISQMRTLRLRDLELTYPCYTIHSWWSYDSRLRCPFTVFFLNTKLVKSEYTSLTVFIFLHDLKDIVSNKLC